MKSKRLSFINITNPYSCSFLSGAEELQRGILSFNQFHAFTPCNPPENGIKRLFLFERVVSNKSRFEGKEPFTKIQTEVAVAVAVCLTATATATCCKK